MSLILPPELARQELAKRDRQIRQLDDTCSKLSHLNEVFVAVAKSAIERLEEHGIPLDEHLQTFITDIRKFEKSMGLDSPVIIAPALNQEA